MAATKAKRAKAKAKAEPETKPKAPKTAPAATVFGGGFAPFKES